jgi:hypothetical protein
MLVLEKGQYDEALKVALDGIEGIKGVDEHLKDPPRTRGGVAPRIA